MVARFSTAVDVGGVAAAGRASHHRRRGQAGSRIAGCSVSRNCAIATGERSPLAAGADLYSLRGSHRAGCHRLHSDPANYHSQTYVAMDHVRAYGQPVYQRDESAADLETDDRRAAARSGVNCAGGSSQPGSAGRCCAAAVLMDSITPDRPLD